MDKTKTLIILFILDILLCVALFLNVPRKGGVVKVIKTTDTIVKVDTFLMPVAKDSVVTRYIREALPLVHDTIVTTDSVMVEIPITSKVYSDSTYKAWVSGYRPSLDSIQVFNKIVTNTERVEIVKYKSKRFGVGVQVGGGYGTNGFSPYIGVGVSYNIINF